MFDFINFNWLDYSLILLVAAIAGLFARRKLAGLVVGIAAILLIKPLLMLGQQSAVLALIVGIVASIALAILGQFLNEKDPFAPSLQMLLGGIGGFLFGLSMLFALVTALPLNIVNGQIIYPSNVGRSNVSFAIEDSQLVNIGRDILLYDVYVLNNLRQSISTANPDFVETLNGYLVAGEPWN